MNVQDKYYLLATIVEEITRSRATASAEVAGPSNAVTPNNVPNTAIITRRIKLPETPLPTFDGRYKNWLSFKNRFLAIIDSRIYAI